MVLNAGQEKITQQGVSWFYNSPEQVFEIDGEAGTGKSVVLHEIVKRLGLQPYQYMSMAYTGQAAIIMRLKGFTGAKSIHSSLYQLEKRPVQFKSDPFRKINTEFNTDNFEYVFCPIPIGGINHQTKLIIIDEGRMVPKYMLKDILKHGIKVLVGGDEGQLPPIGDDPAFLTGYNIHHLTEIMRQSLNDPIVYLAHRARRGLPIDYGQYGNSALVIEESDLSLPMIINIGNIICGTNRSRDYFNNGIRQSLGLDKYNIPQFGERVICRNNNWNVEQDGIALANGLTGVVSNPTGLGAFDGKTYTFDFLPDLLNTPFRDLKADYKYICSPYDIRNDMKKNRKFSNGDKFEYAYSLTTHLAQGAEFPCGIYYEEFLRSNIQNLLNYTGITRFKKYLVYVKKGRKYY